MKKLLFTFAVLLSSFAAQAQEIPYQSLLREDRVWVNYYDYHGDYDDETDESTSFSIILSYRFHGDTIVDGHTYKVCYELTDDPEYKTKAKRVRGCAGSVDWDKYKKAALVREEGLKVYARFPISNGFSDYEDVLYDFEQMRKEFKMEEVEIAGQKCMKYYNEYEEEYIESIGSSSGVGTLLSPIWGIPTCFPFAVSGLSHVLDDQGNIIFMTKEFVGQYGGIKDVRDKDNFSHNNQYYNIKGQAVDIKSAPAGIYIHNGKKVIVK